MIEDANDRQRDIERAANDARGTARQAWASVNPAAVMESWRSLMPRIAGLIAGIQTYAAATADRYVEGALDAQGIDYPNDYRVNPDALAWYASDGRPLTNLLMAPAAKTLHFMEQGMEAPLAMAAGQVSLDLIVATQVADAFRIADSVASVARRAPDYVRVLGPNPCSRCIQLAGQVDYQTPFERHPNCSCGTVPSSQAATMPVESDPTMYFENLAESEQDRIFTKAGAQAIRDGANMDRVVNARRRASGMRSASDYELSRKRRKRRGTEWAELAATEGPAQGRGRLRRRSTLAGENFVTFEDPIRLPGGDLAPRLMPESIYEIARDQEHAIALLQRHGYIDDRPAFLPVGDGTYTRVR